MYCLDVSPSSGEPTRACVSIGMGFFKFLEIVSIAEEGRDPGQAPPGSGSPHPHPVLPARCFVSSALQGPMDFVSSKAMNDSLKGQQELVRLRAPAGRRRCGGGCPAAHCLPAAGPAASPADLRCPPGLKVLHARAPPVPVWLPSTAGSGV